MLLSRTLDSRRFASTLAICASIAFSVLAVACATGGNTTPTGEGGSGGDTGATSGSGGMTTSSSGMTTSSSGMTTSSSGMTTTSSSGSTSSSGGGGGAGGAPPVTATQIITVFGGGSSIIANYSDLNNGKSFATPWQDQSDDVIGLASDGTGIGICVYRSKMTSELKYGFYKVDVWVPGFGQPVAPIEMGLTSEGGPSVAGAGGIGHLVYRGADGLYYYGKTQNKQWLTKKEPITAAGKQSAGPNPPAVAALGNAPVVVFVGDDQVFYDQTQGGGTWQAAVAHSFGGKVATFTPAITSLESGPELLAVFGEAVTNKLFWTTRKASVWSPPVEVPGATTADSPVLAPLAGGGAMLGFKGVDQGLYTARLSAGDSPTWTNAELGAGGATPQLISAPALARGATGAEAEMIYVDQNYTVYSTRLVAGAWTTPAFTGSASAHIAIATIP